MQSKILKVFYGEDCLPYKDQERTVHFPITGNAFQGASQTTEIRFYIKDIGGEDLTWVANAKLPNGKVGTKILTVLNDPELEEDYALLQLSKFYTQAKGDLYISLQGYDGSEVEMSFDSDTGLYEISGNPTIQATGSIKLTIAYATPLNAGEEIEEPTLQDILAYFDTKLNIGSSAYIKCVNIVNIENNVFSTEDGYNVGDIIYNKQDKKFGRLITVNSQLRFQIGEIVVSELSVDDGDHRFNFYADRSQDPMFVIEEDGGGKELIFDFAEDDIFFTGNTNVKFLKERNIELSEFPTTLTNSQYSIISKQPSYITLLGTLYEFAKEDSFYIYFKKIAVPEKISHTTYYELNGGYIRVRKTDKYAELFTDSLNVYSKAQNDGLLDTKADKSTTYTKTEVNGLLDDKADKSDTYTKEQTDSAIASAISSVYKYKGSVANYSSLPSSGNTIGDVYNVEDTGDNYAWTGTTWDKLAGTVDLSAYYTASQVDDKLAEKQNVIDSSHKLASDLVDDTNQTNKFVTSGEKTTWNNKQNALVSGTNIKTINGTSLLDSGDYTFDNSLSDSSTNAVQNKVVKENIDKKANVDGNYQTMTVGNADALTPYGENSGANDTTPFVMQSTGGSSDVGVKAYLKALRGNSVGLNQLNANTSSNETKNGITFTKNSDGSWSVSGTATADTFKSLMGGTALYNGHKYLIKGSPNGSSAETYGLVDAWSGTGGVVDQNGKIITLTSDKTYQPAILVKNGVSISTTIIFRPQLFDLTLMFGAGNEPASVLEFNRLFPKTYYEYNVGALLSCKVNGIKNVGYNAFDGELEQGSYSTTDGSKITDYSEARSKNKIEVVGGSSYSFFVSNSASTNHKIFEYDSNGNFIKYQSSYNNEQSFTLSNNTKYVALATAYSLLNEQWCLHLTWDGSRTGYEPYESKNYALPNIELRSAGSVYDELKPDGTLINRVGTIVFDGSNDESIEHYAGYRFLLTIPLKNNVVENTSLDDLKCNRLETIVQQDIANKIGISGKTDIGTAVIVNPNNSITELSDFKTWLSNNPLTINFRLGIFTETQDDAYKYQEIQDIDDFGTQEFLYDSDIAIPVPQGNEFFYPVDYKAFIDSVGGREDINYDADEIVSHSELQASETARDSVDTQLLNAIGGTLRQCLCVKESLDFDNTALFDLSELTGWQYNSGNQRFYVNITGAQGSGNNNTPSKLLCTKYRNDAYGSLGDKGICISSDGLALAVKDSTYTDVDTFKAAMKGVLLAYEKASE